MKSHNMAKEMNNCLEERQEATALVGAVGVTGGFSGRQEAGPVSLKVFAHITGTTVRNTPRECVGSNGLGNIPLIDDLWHWDSRNGVKYEDLKQ